MKTSERNPASRSPPGSGSPRGRLPVATSVRPIAPGGGESSSVFRSQGRIVERPDAPLPEEPARGADRSRSGETATNSSGSEAAAEPGLVGTPGEQGAHVGPLVNAAAVAEDDEVPADLAEYGAQEHRDLPMGDVAPGIEMDVESAAPPPGAHGHRRDRRDFVAAIPMPDDRRVAAGGPGAPDVRNQPEATFAEEHQMGVQARRVLFTATQRYRFQRAMAASSRSTARHSGFWHDQPSVVSSRPT